MPDRIRVAVLGNGFTRQVILPCLQHVEGVVLAGIASPNLERARETAERFGIGGVWRDHRDLLAAARADLVFIATPPHRHSEMAIDSLEAGCHVVCEKPTALDAVSSARMLAAARAAGRRLALIDHELRFHPCRLALRRVVREGRLGEILRASYIFHSPVRRDSAIPWGWWCDRAQGGGALGAIGSHAVDALRVLLGSEVVEVRGILHTFIRERRDPVTGALRPVTSDELAAAWLRFASGSIAELSISMVDGPRFHRIQLAGTIGSAVLDEQAPLRIVEGSSAPIEEPAEWGIPLPADGSVPDTDWARSFLLLARRVIAAIREGAPSVPGAATFEDGHQNQLVLDAIRKSAGDGAWVGVPSH